jgi:hypothetical protein
MKWKRYSIRGNFAASMEADTQDAGPGRKCVIRLAQEGALRMSNMTTVEAKAFVPARDFSSVQNVLSGSRFRARLVVDTSGSGHELFGRDDRQLQSSRPTSIAAGQSPMPSPALMAARLREDEAQELATQEKARLVPGAASCFGERRHFVP